MSRPDTLANGDNDMTTKTITIEVTETEAQILERALRDYRKELNRANREAGAPICEDLPGTRALLARVGDARWQTL